MLHLVEEGIDASDDMFVRNRLNGAGRKQLYTVSYRRLGGWIEGYALRPDPVQGMIEGAEFPRVAGGPPSA